MYFEDLGNAINLKADDIIIAIMGPTGAGKSNIIDKITVEDKRAGHGLESCTREINCVRVKGHPKHGDRIVLVDTPGFDDTKKSDVEILGTIGEWLCKLYEAQIYLSGIIYLHRITDIRMSGAHQASLRMFSELCGEDAAQQVILVTTMWDFETKEFGDQREKELIDYYWGPMLEHGARIARFDNTEKSAWEVIYKLIDKPVQRKALQLQTEMRDFKRPLRETKAARALFMKTIRTDLCARQEKLEHQKTQGAGQLNENDIVIMLMGPSGSGKSHIIDILTGRSGPPTATTLFHSAAEVRTFRIRNHPRYKDRIVLVDTPSFDNPEISDLELLRLISDWLAKTYEEKVFLSGILYLHCITDNRMSGTPHRNLRMFGELCGERAARNVVIVTTMWDRLKTKDLGEDRETFLRERFWKAMLDNGASMARFHNEPKRAQEIIDSVISKRFQKVPLLLQEEIIDYGRRLNETHAGRELCENLQILLAQQRGTIQLLTEQMEGERNPLLAAELIKERIAIQKQLQATLEQVNMLQISTGRKFLLFIGNRPKTRPLNLG